MIKWQKVKGSLTVLCVSIMILFVACTSQIFVIYPYLSPNNTLSILILVSLNFLISMVLINYFLTCKTDPGSVPDRWLPRQQAFIEVKKSTHTLRYCKTCKNYKPPRTHHCSCCDRCVLKMDHHCPWVNNCVGFANYCHFFRFLIHVDLSTIYLFTLLSCRLAQLVRDIRHYNIYPTALEAAFISINMILIVAVMIGVGILTAYHLYCITTNTTTIEGWEKGRSLTIKGMGKIHNIKCPYDQGLYKNIQIVLGPWPIFWFFPRSMSGTGLDFPISTKHIDDENDTIIGLTTEKNFDTSTTSLNRYSSNISSQWTSSAIDLATSTIDMTSSSIDIVSPAIAYSPTNAAKEDDCYYQTTRVDVIPLNETASKPYGAGNKFLNTTITAMPETPGSIITFASTTTTLVDNYYHLPKLPVKQT